MARRFGHTWWGEAWVDALETRARLDPNRLPRGRTYARYDRVSELHLAPGEITARVHGSRASAYRVTVRVHTYGDDDWERVVATIANRAAHAAALLDGELDPSIADDAATSGVDLMPGPGDLQPRCSCPDWADPCKHAAAVCYLVADALDDDPFALFELRGRSRDALMTQLRALRRAGADAAQAGASAGSVDHAVVVDDGEIARDVWSEWAERTTDASVAVAAPLPARPGAGAPWPTDPPDGAPFTASGLRTVAADGAYRAWEQLRGEGGSGLELDSELDLARRAAIVLGDTRAFGELARVAGIKPVDLARRAIAWRHGGADALVMLDAPPWTPPSGVMVAGRAAVAELSPATLRVSVARNRIIVRPLQLRLDQGGRWWRFEKRKGRWEITAPPADDIEDLLALEV